MSRKRLLIISEPIPEGVSVQFDLLKSIISALIQEFEISIISSYISKSSSESFFSMGVREVIVSSNSSFLNHIVWKLLKNLKESVLWGVNWIMESVFLSNSRFVKKIILAKKYDSILSISNTIPAPTNVWWCQGTPLFYTISDMGLLTRLPNFLRNSILALINKFDMKMIHEMSRNTKHMIVNSNHLVDTYKKLDIFPERVLYTIKNLDEFYIESASIQEKYVLAYLGKETELYTLEKLVEKGVKIKAFGSKINNSPQFSRLKNIVDYEFSISNSRLRELYSRASFTVFPFTFEPLGYVPLESMACGTPVLTYDKQGPSETVIDNVTGWLVHNKDDFVKKAIELWNNPIKADMRINCSNRIKYLTQQHKLEYISNYLNG